MGATHPEPFRGLTRGEHGQGRDRSKIFTVTQATDHALQKIAQLGTNSTGAGKLVKYVNLLGGDSVGRDRLHVYFPSRLDATNAPGVTDDSTPEWMGWQAFTM